MDQVAVNKKVRWLDSWYWEPVNAALEWKKCMQFLADINCVDLLHQDIDTFVNFKAICEYGTDKQGRPNLYIRMKNFFPAQTNVDETQRFFIVMLDAVDRNNPYVD